MFRATTLALCAVLACLGGCHRKKLPGVPSGVSLGGDDTGVCERLHEGLNCSAGSAITCADGGVAKQQECADAGLTCNPDFGCVKCTPNFFACDGNRLMACNDKGTELTPIMDCGDLQCSARGCRDLCAEARDQRSYIGCEYWPVFTANSLLDPLFKPAVVVANPNLVAARVSISKGDVQIVSLVVPPQSAQSVMLEFDDILKSATASALVPHGAYHLVSSAPVTVHQFNPLLFELDQDCARPETGGLQVPGDGKCNSFTNDASLLLPAHVLSSTSVSGVSGVSYLGISRASFLVQGQQQNASFQGVSGFLAIVGAGTGPVHVKLKSSAFTRPSQDGTVGALSPGDTAEITLTPGDVFQLLSATPDTCPGTTGKAIDRTVCDPGASYDLTGTEIEADGPVQVIGGHDCTYVPFDRVACDHLEESMFPVETWGTTVIAARPRASTTGSYMLRVVSGADGNQIHFDPAIAMPIMLDRGKVFEIETTQHVIVTGTQPLAVAQYMVGQGATSRTGDPSLSLAIPVDQYRSSYIFLSPETYSSNFISVIVNSGERVLVDGEELAEFEQVASSMYSVGTLVLSRPGEHEIHTQSGALFGLVLYGFGDYTSYMLPGGLDLQLINNPL